MRPARRRFHPGADPGNPDFGRTSRWPRSPASTRLGLPLEDLYDGRVDLGAAAMTAPSASQAESFAPA